MPIIEIDKSVLEEIEDVIDQRDKMYENHIATTKKLTDSIEKVYEQEVKKLRNQLQQKENIIKEVREYIKQLLEYKKEDYYKGISLDYVERILDILEGDLKYE